MRCHLTALHDFHGDFMGIRIARKHVGWFLDAIEHDVASSSTEWKRHFNALQDAEAQQTLLQTLELRCTENSSTLRNNELAA
jgi:tRNA-dihydrouridine synthase B